MRSAALPGFLHPLPLLQRSLQRSSHHCAPRRPRPLHTSPASPAACASSPTSASPTHPSDSRARAPASATAPPKPSAARPPPPPPPPRGDTLLIVGLGNPGSRFDRTRHNIGFELLDAYAKRHGAAPFRPESRHRALTSSLRAHGRTVHLAKPTTFMNASGDAVRSLMRYYKLPPTALLVVADDIALDVGRLRIRAKGSAGGHNGLKSIQKALAGPDYARLKVGVGVPPGAKQWADFVLAKFSKADQQRFEQVEWDVSDILDFWVKEDDFNRVSNKLGMMQKNAS